MSMPEENLTLKHTQFLTAALRSWLVNHLLPDALAGEMAYCLLELGDELPAQQSPAAMRDFLKRQMSLLSGKSDLASQQHLIRLCEGVVQLYLLKHPDQSPELDQLNQLLPPGLSFSLISGHLIFEPELFFQAHNLYHVEQAFQVVPPAELPAGSKNPALSQAPDPEPELAQTLAQEPLAASVSASEAKPSFSALSVPQSAEAAKHEVFREIRQRRLLLLKEWESPHGQS